MAPSRILSYFARHRTAANLLLAVLLILGLAAFPNMRAQFFPDVVVDDIDVSVRWDGAGADDVDRAIIDVLEPALTAVTGVTEVSATAREGSARIELEFEPNWDMAQAADDVQAAIETISDLPEDADDPTIRRSTWWDRVTDVVITGPVGVDQLARFADEFTARLFAVGVTNVTIRGVAAPETIVEVPSINLIRHDLSMAEIADAIAAEAAVDPAGTVTGAQRLRTGTERRGEDIAAIALRSEADGTTLTIGDVATVYVEGVDRERAYFVGDDPAISIRVDRSAQGDAIKIQRTVEEVAAEMVATLPAGVSIDLIRTRAEAISARLNILLDNGLMGLGLVVLLLFLFLNARTAFWVAAGIPVAMTAAIAMMYAAGLTLNMVSLFALIITLGIVVDDAIVVGEHADNRARRLGESPPTAAERAATRMFTPVFAASLTTIIAFFGLTVIGGRFGEMIKDIPFTVIVVLVASLVECFLILPNHMAHSLAHSAKEHWYDWPSRQVNRGFRWVREQLFRPLMAGVIWLRYPVIAGTILVLASQVTLFISGEVQWRFWNPPERASITGNFSMLPGATREDTLEQVRLLQETVDEVEARYVETYGTSPVSYVLAEVGGVSWRGLAGSDTKEPDQLGSISIELIDADLRPYSSFQIVGDLQDALRRHPMSETISFRGWRSGPEGNALEVEIFGANAETLKAAAEDLKTQLAGFPEVSALEDSLSYDREELILNLTPRGQALGFDIDALGRILRNRLNGVEAATYPAGTRTASIRVELPLGEISADFMDRIILRAGEGAYVPLSDIVTVERRTGFSQIRRENGQRVVTVSGDINEDDPARAAAVDAALSGEILRDIEERYGVVTELSGLAEEENEFLADALQGLILCLAGIYLVLAWVFSSWSRPVIVMAIIPFGLVGAIYGHALWELPLSMFSIVGLIGMTGIIINDSIVLVTTVDEHAQSRALVPAIIDGAADRLRPVLLTTLTTVLGLTPLLYEGSRQAEFLKPTVITLVYGLGFGMVLVLLVVPALLAIQRDVGDAMRAFRRALRAGGAAGRIARGTGAVAALIFAATVGPVLLGNAPAWLTGTLPGADPLLAALGLFTTGVLALVLIVWIAAGLAVRRA
ncbi:efflux RND transporter permease subunit [Ovoidimarina sediminis]|uniref:efflux RND transporter permease subunit n=1 Tax=Ovoidimarina sediminis TaxID=3079856 RepID=UPI002909BF4D|nr:efflux RND transporter permease subunit [Rhodophyticola sp. MJ-SS7]MDU8943506.1 efflux RND transporter permease subunit [Rhodophyticola sp. MJ-SS7]